MTKFTEWEQKAKLIRKLCLESTTRAGSGHPTSCLSAVDLMTVLFDKYYVYDLDNPLNYNNDRLIFSKGHAAPLLYALYAVAGALSFDELMTLRKFTSRLEGHPTSEFPYAEAATGSLGQGLSIGAGMAYFGKIKGLSNKVYTLLGDGELAEGQVWEAANFASYYKLDNLIVIADINRLGQSQETMFGHKIDEYQRRFEAFGFESVVIDGHDFSQIDTAFQKALTNTTQKPFAILAKTFKGKGISFLEDREGEHGKVLKKEQLDAALVELGEIDNSLRFTLKKPQPVNFESETEDILQTDLDLSLQKGEQIATREIYGTILAHIAKSDLSIIALDADVKNSTFSQDFLKAYPDRFIECFIAEQNMVGVALGLSRLRRTPFVSTFAAFFTRAFDQIRMAAISRANIKFVGSHAGVSIGEDGPSQMGLEDIAMFGSIPQSVVLQPSDAVSAAKLIKVMVDHKGISYLRTFRPKTAVIYDNDEEFVIGGSKVIYSSSEDILTVIASGITVHEAIQAHEMLQKEGINIRVVDCYSIKPLDKKTIEQCINETRKKIIITVEDHFEHGGLGDFVLDAVSTTGAKVVKLAVTHISHSGSKDELLADAGINSAKIINKIKELIVLER